jgi:hypothetical protein
MTRPSSDPSTNVPLNPPDVPTEEKIRQLEGERPVEDQAAYIDISDTDDLGTITPTEIYEGELAAGVNDDLPNDPEQIELLTELEMREGETDDPMEAIEEGFTYVPPTDPPTVPSDNYDGAEVASGFGGSSLEEPYDANHHDEFAPDDDEMTTRVREALLADSSTTAYAHRIAIAVRNNIVTIRGVVDDLTDAENLQAVAGYVAGVEDVVDETTVRGLG